MSTTPSLPDGERTAGAAPRTGLPAGHGPPPGAGAAAASDEAGDPLRVEHFDGRSARPRPVWLRVHGDRLWLHADPGDALPRGGPPAPAPPSYPLRGLDWPERQRHGPRNLRLPDGGSLYAADGAAWDAWSRRHRAAPERWVVRWQQHWPATLAAMLLLVATLGAAWAWGLPWAAKEVAERVPADVQARLGEAVHETLVQRGLLADSRLPAERADALRRRFAQVLAARGTPAPTHRILLHASRLGPNALALPGGTIVVTDQLAELLADREDVLVGVLAHELGHVEARHGLRSLVQVSLLGVATGMLWGDFSGTLAGGASLLGQQAYSRDFEREADMTAIRTLQAAGIDPAVMAVLFDRLAERRQARGSEQGADVLGIALASHPSDDERRRRFAEAGPRR